MTSAVQPLSKANKRCSERQNVSVGPVRDPFQPKEQKIRAFETDGRSRSYGSHQRIGGPLKIIAPKLLAETPNGAFERDSPIIVPSEKPQGIVGQVG